MKGGKKLYIPSGRNAGHLVLKGKNIFVIKKNEKSFH
jgi:hypothetical protein